MSFSLNHIVKRGEGEGGGEGGERLSTAGKMIKRVLFLINGLCARSKLFKDA